MPGLRSVLAVALLLTALHEQSTAGEPAYYDSLRLVSAMREDELMLLAARAAKAKNNALTEQNAQCLDRHEYQDVTDIPARKISDKLTAAEVEDAIKYFQSAGGHKFVRRNELALKGKPSSDAPGLSAAEQAELEEFKKRPAGRKLLRDLVLRQRGVMQEVLERVDRHLDDCAYAGQSGTELPAALNNCESKAVASTDNVCLAAYAATGLAKLRRATVQIRCRNGGRILTSTIDLPRPESPVALRWSEGRELEILVQNDKIRIESSSTPGGASPRFRFASRQPTDPPVLQCLPSTRGRGSLASTLPLNTTVAAWRTDRRPGLCLMTARVPEDEVPGADGDMLLQFRQQKPASLPFATTRLAFVVQIYQLRVREERPLLISAGQARFEKIEHGPQQTHMLTGNAAAAMLKDLASKPAELTVKPGGAQSYAIPVRRQDFDFAYADFSECVAGLKAT